MAVGRSDRPLKAMSDAEMQSWLDKKMGKGGRGGGAPGAAKERQRGMDQTAVRGLTDDGGYADNLKWSREQAGDVPTPKPRSGAMRSVRMPPDLHENGRNKPGARRGPQISKTPIEWWNQLYPRRK